MCDKINILLFDSKSREFDMLGKSISFESPRVSVFARVRVWPRSRVQPLSCEENLHSSLMTLGATVICVQFCHSLCIFACLFTCVLTWLKCHHSLRSAQGPKRGLVLNAKLSILQHWCPHKNCSCTSTPVAPTSQDYGRVQALLEVSQKKGFG